MAFASKFLKGKGFGKSKLFSFGLLPTTGFIFDKLNTNKWNNFFQNIEPMSHKGELITPSMTEEEKHKAIIGQLKWELNQTTPNIDKIQQLSHHKNFTFDKFHPIRQALINHATSQFYDEDRDDSSYGYASAFYYGELQCALS